MRIRSGRGLGDTIYLRPIVEHFVRKGRPVVALTDFPEILAGSGAEVQPFIRNGADVVAHYVGGKGNPLTTQWQDMCAASKIGQIELRFGWQPLNVELLERVHALAAGKPIILVHGGRAPYGRQDGYGRELVPDRAAFVSALREIDGFRILVGKDAQIYPLDDCVDLDLSGQTSVCDLLDLGSACAGVVAQCSFAVPLAEVFDKPLLAVWAQAGLRSNDAYISATTPKKILSKPTSRFVMDSWGAKIQEEAHAFRGLL